MWDGIHCDHPYDGCRRIATRRVRIRSDEERWMCAEHATSVEIYMATLDQQTNVDTPTGLLPEEVTYLTEQIKQNHRCGHCTHLVTFHQRTYTDGPAECVICTCLRR